MAQRHQQGWLKREKRSRGENSWCRSSVPCGSPTVSASRTKFQLALSKTSPSKSCACAELERQHLHINQVDFRGCVTLRIWHITTRNMSS